MKMQLDNRKLLLLATAASILLWMAPFGPILLYPLRLFVTFVHESGHALTALATGGDVISMTIRPDGSGLTYTRTAGWALPFVYSGGYLGATAFGALMLHTGRLGRRGMGRTALGVAGGFLFLVVLLWCRTAFSVAAGLIIGVLLLGMARLLPPRAAEFAASFVAVQCCLNAITDLVNLLYLTSAHIGDNDAVFMSRAVGMPPEFWALIWAGIAGATLFWSLRVFWRRTRVRKLQSVAA
ncbi:MAG: M50 family metallopeptidase [Armatimonadetes bacterium]|nr:M50 family metallopeptidase [Armatimonadota bacterium]MDE2207453.1 M50 family metallopeptidase [Armatimonadota bacterium]